MRGDDGTAPQWRAMALRQSITWVLILGTGVALLTIVVTVAHDPAGLLSPTYVAMMGLFASLAAVRQIEVSYRLRAVTFIVVTAVMGSLALLNFGLAPGPPIALCLATLCAGVFLGRWALLLTLGLTSLAIVACGLLVTRHVVVPVSPSFVAEGMIHWYRTAVEYALFSGSVAGLVHALIAGLERQEATMARQRRLEALGRLAGGVAHDFNNALQVVITWAELLKDSDDELVQEAVNDIREASGQASRMTAQLLAFGRRDVWAPRDLDLASEVSRWAQAMRRLVPEDIALELEVDGAPTVHCDPGQLEQILLNLVVNARDAIGGEGRIEILVDEVRPDPRRGNGAFARLRVRDDGPGIEAEALSHVFEPFFSTKEEVGTGLGLSIVHGAVTRARGTVDVTSTVGEGTTFTILLPIKPADTPVEARAREEFVAAPARAGDTILVAEDDGRIRRSVVAYLREAGYTVLEAEDGDRAAELVDEQGETVDVLCTDGVMPGTPTRSVIERFLSKNPAGRVLVCSGHVEEELLRRDIAGPRLELLPKPFAPEELLDRLAGPRR